MPGGDKTGPRGQGAMTGRGMGFCSGNDQPGFRNINLGRGRQLDGGQGNRSGRNLGMGFRHGRKDRFYSDEISSKPIPFNRHRNDELSKLKEESKNLSNALNDINKRIEELETS